MVAADFFSPDYRTARERFRRAVGDAPWRLSTYTIEAKSPDGDTLTIDVAVAPAAARDTGALVLSSGLHGVEGYFGSAVQLALLERWRAHRETLPAERCVLIHALNPYGFAWSRRVNEDNVDLNRNLLLESESYDGCPDGYRALDRLLNPKRPPSRFDFMMLKSLLAVAHHGMPALKQAIMSGQYEYPRGLFYGGAGPTAAKRVLTTHFDEWLGASERIVHLDFHTGLGPFATYKLLADYPVDIAKREQLWSWFGRDRVEISDSSGVAYITKGNFGRWCLAHRGTRDYTYATAEFGTYGPQRMLAGLRAENQAHHWGKPDCASTRRAKGRLVELFCPRSAQWRNAVLAQTLQLVDSATRALTD